MAQLVYSRGILLDLLRPALPGCTVVSKFPGGWEDRLPLAYVQVFSDAQDDPRFAFAQVQVQIDFFASDDFAAFQLADRAHGALVEASANRTVTPHGSVSKLRTSGVVGGAQAGATAQGIPPDVGHYRLTFSAVLERPAPLPATGTQTTA